MRLVGNEGGWIQRNLYSGAKLSLFLTVDVLAERLWQHPLYSSNLTDSFLWQQMPGPMFLGLGQCAQTCNEQAVCVDIFSLEQTWKWTTPLFVEEHGLPRGHFVHFDVSFREVYEREIMLFSLVNAHFASI